MGKKSERRERRTAEALAREAEERGALIEKRRRQSAEADAAADRADEARLAGEPTVPMARAMIYDDPARRLPRGEGTMEIIAPSPAPPIYRRRPMSRALLALTLLGLGGLPRNPGEA